MSVYLVKRFRGHEERLRKAGLVTCEDYKEAADRIEELEDKLAKAVEALGFYADDEHWNPTYADPGMSPFSAAEEDEGKTARAVLAELEDKRHA